MKKLKSFWYKFQRISFFIGNIISGIFLLIFYFSVFMVFAVPFKLFSKPLGSKSRNSNWQTKNFNFESLEDFKNE